MSEQAITPELRHWIVEQTGAGHTLESVRQSMLASGWQEDTAALALAQTLGLVAEPAEPAAPTTPPASVVPEPLPGAPVTTLWAGDRPVHVLATLRHPRVIVFGGLLGEDECDALIELARERLVRSETVQTATGASEVNEARTSLGMFFARAENALCARIEQRMSALLGWPLENGEGLQILRYGPGAEYKPHYDYFDPHQPGTPSIVRRGGQRVASLVCYLNSPLQGGATVFPDAGFDVAPIKGNAVFFSYDRPHPSTRSLHGGAPVVEGEKWVATKWMRQGRFE